VFGEVGKDFLDRAQKALTRKRKYLKIGLKHFSAKDT
jgi:hypothetical protein